MGLACTNIQDEDGASMQEERFLLLLDVKKLPMRVEKPRIGALRGENYPKDCWKNWPGMDDFLNFFIKRFNMGFSHV